MGFDLRNRGVCHPDGQNPGDHPAKDGRSFYCEDHAPDRIKAQWAGTQAKRQPRSDARDTATIKPPPDPDKDTGKGDDDKPKGDTPKDKRTAQIKALILSEANPKLPLGFAFLCRPIPPNNFYTCWQDDAGKLHPTLNTKNNVTPTELGKAVQLSDGKAAVIAAAAAEIESMPQVQFVEKVAGPYKGWAVIAAAAVALGAHAWTVFQLRDQLLTSYQLQLKTQTEAVSHSPGATGPVAVPDPPEHEAEPDDGRDVDAPEAAQANGRAVGFDSRMGADIPDVSAAV